MPTRPSAVVAIACVLVACSTPPSRTGAGADALGPPAVVPSSTPSVPVAAGLAALPRDAAIYATLEVDFAERFVLAVGDLSESSLVRAPLHEVGIERVSGAAAALAEKTGLDRARPIRAAFGIVDVDAAERAMQTVRRAADGGQPIAAALTAVQASPTLIASRVIFPLETSRDGYALIDALGKMSGASIERCDRPPPKGACGDFAALAPLAVHVDDDRTVLFYASEDALVADAIDPFLETPDATALAAHARRAREVPTGGPRPGVCPANDDPVGSWICIDPDRVADFGAVTGWSATVRAVANDALAADLVGRLLEQGMYEASMSKAQANADRRLLEGMSITLEVEGEDLVAVWRWATTPEGREVFERVLPQPVAAGARYADWVEQLVQPTIRGVGHPGHDQPADKETALRQIQEGGWASLVVLGARRWPNFLTLVSDEIDPANPPGMPFEVRAVRAAMEGDILSLRAAARVTDF